MDNKNKKIMFITLGTGAGVSHGILFSIKKQSPNIVVFIISNESLKTYDELLNQLQGKQIEIIKEECNEVNDIEIIYKVFSSIIQRYLNKGFTKENIVVDYTSGTKAMSAAIVSVAIAKGLENFSYVYGSRDSDGRVVSGTERLNSLTVNRIVTENYLKLFQVFFNKNQFDLALNVLDQLKEVHPDYSERIVLNKALATAFSFWEKFNFIKSFNILDSIDIELRSKYGIKTKIETLKAVLYKLKEKTPNIEKVHELMRNALRRAEEGKYDDAVARLYRTLEMIGQIEFIKEFGHETNSVIPKKLPENVKKYLINKYSCKEEEQLKLGLRETFILLEKKGNEIGKKYFVNEKIFKYHLEKRNHSILAHGSNPLDEKAFVEFYDFVKSFIGPVPVIDFPKLEA
ncbi:MAG: TIGR02710 family CRISPR-associated protein [Bacteroidetes bacterium]|nr:TIGR02710 family CRISPR-associated protein [Bacteroidota bacterium]MBU2584302.1 TIGR02710 family CRISPR-associated protein [Bacteroidota bacterium]